LVKRAEVNMRFTGEQYRKTEHCFDEECMEKTNETKEGLRKKTTMKTELNIGKAERNMKEQ
jgi:hypothetical protein